MSFIFYLFCFLVHGLEDEITLCEYNCDSIKFIAVIRLRVLQFLKRNVMILDYCGNLGQKVFVPCCNFRIE